MESVECPAIPGSTEPSAPSAPPPPLQKQRTGPRLSVASVASQAPPGGSFSETLQQIQALQLRLLHLYEEAGQTESRRGTKKFAKQLTIVDNRKSPAKEASPAVSDASGDANRNDTPDRDAPGEVSPQHSRNSRDSAGRESGVCLRLAKSAHELTLLGANESAGFLVGIEWSMEDDELQELQQTNALTSPKAPTSGAASGTAASRMRANTEKNLSGCAMSPESPKRMVWDVLAMLALLVEVLTAPLQVYDITGDVRQVADVLQWLTTSYWVLDVPASFLTAVYIDDILHTRLADVARVYLKSWFWFDMLMLAPEVVFFVNMVSSSQNVDGESEDPGASGVLRALRARRLVRVFRFFRIMRFRKAMALVKKLSCYKYFRTFFQGWISSSLVPILSLMFGLMIAIHFLASLWFLAGAVEDGWAFVEGLHEAPFGQQYVRSVEWAVSRLPASSLRANVALNTAFERWLAIVATFVSLVISSLFISVLTNLMADVARKTRKMTQILESVRKYCGTCGVSFRHTMKIRRLVEREHCRASIQDHMEFLLTLPEGLVRELFHEARAITLAFHPFFLELGSANTAVEMQLCNKAAQELYLLEFDVIFPANQKGQGIYILASGGAKYLPGSEIYQPDVSPQQTSRPPHTSSTISHFFNVVAGREEPRQREEDRHGSRDVKQEVSVSSDEYLSEQALWIRGWKHQGRAEATVESRSLHLSTTELRAVLQDYSDALAMAVVYARSFVGIMNCLAPEDISDMPLDLTTGAPKHAGSLMERIASYNSYRSGPKRVRPA